jgi:hypothetical protein
MLLPILDSKSLINTETAAIENLRYLNGYPRQYRFDASRGIFNVNGETPITKKGENLTIIPIAYRIFFDDILGFGPRKWAEFFFINGNHNVCELLVHGFSVENLMIKIQQMYYDNVSLCDVALILSPIERTNKAVNSKYFIADFDYKILEKDTVDTLKSTIADFKLCRQR